MRQRDRLHQMVDDLGETQLNAAERTLKELVAASGDDPVMRRLLREILGDVQVDPTGEGNTAWSGGVPPPSG